MSKIKHYFLIFIKQIIVMVFLVSLQNTLPTELNTEISSVEFNKSEEKSIKNIVVLWETNKSAIKSVDRSITPEMILEYLILSFIVYSSDEYTEYIGRYCTPEDVKNSLSKTEANNVLKSVFTDNKGGNSYKHSNSISTIINIIDQLPISISQEDIQKLYHNKSLEKYASYIIYSLIYQKNKSPYYNIWFKLLKKYEFEMKTLNIFKKIIVNQDDFLFALAEFLNNFLQNFFPYFCIHESFENINYQKKENLITKQKLLPTTKGILSLNNMLLIACNRFFGISSTIKNKKYITIEKLNANLLNLTLQLSGISQFEKFLREESNFKKKSRLWFFYSKEIGSHLGATIARKLSTLVILGATLYGLHKLYSWNTERITALAKYNSKVHSEARSIIASEKAAEDISKALAGIKIGVGAGIAWWSGGVSGLFRYITGN